MISPTSFTSELFTSWTVAVLITSIVDVDAKVIIVGLLSPLDSSPSSEVLETTVEPSGSIPVNVAVFDKNLLSTSSCVIV